ncbi:differentially expressed in FDCP 8 homolog [Liolophura sinensis]|uniref:differentially expressed in FDCP 8 homolog n=1 Tax=Liolophura sinensis TaxID=3198878 RepID=UPI00315909A8
MTDLDHGQACRLPAAYPEMSSDYKQLTNTSGILPGCQTSPGERPDPKENIHTVETEQASIKFFGGVPVGGSFSESDSEEEPQNYLGVNSVSELLHDQDDSSNPIDTSVKLKLNTGGIINQQTANKTEQIVNNGVTFPDSEHQKAVRNNQTEPGEVTQNDTAEAECILSSEKDVNQTRKSKIGRENFDNNGQCGNDVLKGDNSDLPAHVDRPSISNGSDCADHVTRMRQTRFNPFDRDVVFEEDHFATPEHSFLEASRDYTNHFSPGHHHGRPAQSFSSTSDSFSLCSPDFNDDDFSFADLGLAEDHFSRPEGHFGMSTLEELEMAMENCKDMIKEVPHHSDKQKTLVRKLVHLRMKYQEYKEGPEPVEPDVKMVVGHKFKQKDSRSSKHYCEKCNAVIWGMLQVWYRCTECGYHCHEKCLNQITRTCASVKVAENPSYILSICPEKGLAYQNYRCAECRAHISFKSGFSEPRLCDYSGNYYCELCHWNDVMIIPARVLHNWDFEPQKVCRAAKQYLRLMTSRAVLRIQDINPMLFNFVEELDDVKKLREEILIMKKYFLSCKSALDSKLLLQLSSRQHCVENSDMYSLTDLVDVHSDVLLPELAKVHSSFAQHIKSDCQLCQAKGFICELCDTHEVLFPFDNIAVVCHQCSYVLHRHCFVKRDNLCPRCERRNKRNEKSLGTS